jgi:hypothetical protein
MLHDRLVTGLRLRLKSWAVAPPQAAELGRVEPCAASPGSGFAQPNARDITN